MKKRRLTLLGLDTIVYLTICFLMMFLLFGENYSSTVHLTQKIFHIILGFALLVISRFVFSAYHRVWRFASYNDYFRLIFADTVAGVVYAIINRIIFLHPQFINYIDQNISLTFLQVLAIFSCNCIVCLALRFLYQHFRNKSKEENEAGKINIAIVGAGSVGVSLAKDLKANRYSKYTPIYFIDKDKDKSGNAILDIPIIIEDDTVVERIKNLPVQEIVIALPKLSPEEKAQKYALYQQSGLTVKLYDYPLDYTSGDKRTLRDVKIEDLLFRSSVEFENSKAKFFYTGKTILISGGGGSIGSELARQIAKVSPSRLIILDIYENNAYEIQQSLKRSYGDSLELIIEIASIRDYDKMDELFSKYKPDIVLHAAAHKHVPLMENCPSEAVKNNVFGTYNLVQISEKYEVKKFIMISTDKAVNPTNIMGATKRMCEMIIQSKKNSNTDFVAVRFGNVLGSNGSVIPLFRKQIESGGPVTVTDKRIIRYFMTIPEAAQLVLEAGAMADKSDIYVLDMGKPVKIIDLAENMIRLSGFTPYVDIDIDVIGLRPGEKLYEELLIKTETLDKTENSLIFIERDEAISSEELDNKLCVLTDALDTCDGDKIRSALMKVVPTFHNAEEINKKAASAHEMQMVENTCNV